MTYPIKVTITEQGNSDARPVYKVNNAYLLLVATGSTSAGARGAIEGSNSSYACFTIPVGSSAEVAIETTAATVYAGVTAVRPGSAYSSGTINIQQIFTGRTWNTFSVTVVYGIHDKYMSHNFAVQGNAISPYYIKQKLPNITGSTYAGKLARMNNVTSFWEFRTGNTATTLTTTQMGSRYAAISKTFYPTSYWTNGAISYYSMPQGYTISNYASMMQITIINDTPQSSLFAHLEIKAKSASGQEVGVAVQTGGHDQAIGRGEEISGYYLYDSYSPAEDTLYIGGYLMAGTGSIESEYACVGTVTIYTYDYQFQWEYQLNANQDDQWFSIDRDIIIGKVEVRLT